MILLLHFLLLLVSTANLGKIKFFNATKGFGFVIPNNGPDLFFHVSGCAGITEQDLQPDTEISFDIETDNQGRKKAVNIRKLS